MEFNVSSAELLKALMDVSKAIPAKSPLPILENFLFVLNGNRLEITASDQELTLRTGIDVENAKKDGSIAVPAKHVMEILKALPDQPITIKTSGDSAFECLWSNGNSSLPYFPAEDYPEIKSISEGARTIEFPAEGLIDGINGTVYACGDDEMRPYMNGIFFDINPGSATLVASDSHKLICYTSKDVKADAPSSFILHSKAANVLKSVISKDGEDVKISFDENNVVFSFGATVMICRPVVGRYPEYRKVIPQNNANILNVDRARLLGTAKRIAICANKANNYIKFELKPGSLEITAQDLGFAIAAYEKLECDYAGEPLTIGFKSSFFIEILSNMSCENMVMKFADTRKAALIIPAEDEDEHEKMCGIIMPIMVS